MCSIIKRWAENSAYGGVLLARGWRIERSDVSTRNVASLIFSVINERF